MHRLPRRNQRAAWNTAKHGLRHVLHWRHSQLPTAGRVSGLRRPPGRRARPCAHAAASAWIPETAVTAFLVNQRKSLKFFSWFFCLRYFKYPRIVRLVFFMFWLQSQAGRGVKGWMWFQPDTRLDGSCRISLRIVTSTTFRKKISLPSPLGILLSWVDLEKFKYFEERHLK